jgi:hypothetical protein
MLKQLEDSSTITRAQCDALVSREHFLCGRERGAQHERRQIEAFVRGSSGEDALLLTGGAKLDAIVSDSRSGWHYQLRL